MGVLVNWRKRLKENVTVWSLKRDKYVDEKEVCLGLASSD